MVHLVQDPVFHHGKQPGDEEANPSPIIASLHLVFIEILLAISRICLPILD